MICHLLVSLVLVHIMVPFVNVLYCLCCLYVVWLCMFICYVFLVIVWLLIIIMVISCSSSSSSSIVGGSSSGT